MRIAYVQFTIYSAGGGGRFLDEVISRLAPKHEVGVFALHARTTHLDHLDSSVIFNSGCLPPNRFVRALVERKRIGNLLSSVKKWSPDVLVVSSPYTLRYTRWLSLQSGIPTVSYIHNMVDEFEDESRQIEEGRLKIDPRNPLVRLYRQWGTPRGFESGDLRASRLAICVSHAVERTVKMKFPTVRTMVNYNGVDHTRFSPTWEDEGYVLCASRFSREKNLEFLIDAFNRSKVKLIISGTVEPSESLHGVSESESYFQRLARKASENIVLEVHRDERSLLRRLQTCSVFLHPSINEAFGLSPLEAMACGKVVCAHNSGGTPEVVGKVGFLLGDDQAEWRRQVEELMSEPPSLRRKLGIKALQWSRQFTWERTTRVIETALESAIAESRTRHESSCPRTSDFK